jgi:hypothetical protein
MIGALVDQIRDPAESSLTPRLSSAMAALSFSGVVRISGIAFGWMAPTSVFGSVVRNA